MKKNYIPTQEEAETASKQLIKEPNNDERVFGKYNNMIFL